MTLDAHTAKARKMLAAGREVDALRAFRRAENDEGVVLGNEIKALGITVLARLGRFAEAASVFDGVEEPDENVFKAALFVTSQGKLGARGVEIFDRMLGVGFAAQVEDCNCVLEGLQRAKLYDCVVDFFIRILTLGKPKPNITTFNLMIACFADQGDIVRALEVLYLMKRNQVTITRNSICYILNACAESERDDLAKKVFTIVQEMGVEPDVTMYNALIRVIVRCGKFRTAEQYFQELGQRRNLETYNTYIEEVANMGRVSKAAYLFFDMRRQGFAPDEYTYRSILRGCSKNKEGIQALRFLDDMRTDGCRISWTDKCMVLKAIVGEDNFRSLQYDLGRILDYAARSSELPEYSLRVMTEFDRQYRLKTRSSMKA